MAVVQTRPYELAIYDQSLDPSTVMINVDNSAWPRPKRLPLSLLDTTGSTGTGVNIERDILSGLSSRNVVVEFGTAFSSIPVGRVWVYRMDEMPDGTYRESDVLWGFDNANQPTLSGFALTINAAESLTGIFVKYFYL